MNIHVERPPNLARALAWLAAEQGSGDTPRVLAGGTDLMVELAVGRSRPSRVLDVWRLDELRGVEVVGGRLRIGALVTCRELRSSPLARLHADVLVQAAAEVGAVQIQNRATLGGNLGTASPAADLNPVLVALGASVTLLSTEGPRELPVEAFLRGYRETARRPDELIESVHIPLRPAAEQRAFRKVGTRRAQSISKVVVAVALSLDQGRVSEVRAGAGSVAPQVVRLSAFEAELRGKALDAQAIAAAARAAARVDASPIDDVRSTETYRRFVLESVLRNMLADLVPTP